MQSIVAKPFCPGIDIFAHVKSWFAGGKSDVGFNQNVITAKAGCSTLQQTDENHIMLSK
ncbi:hypothetical protein ACG2F4_07920 [Halalkalibaculum sp. DA3122]|uniref:hypothetical protein n=1 Tax=Halalkalibaculum sp. DA3122 TaxID=3373607 RepID=UPI003754457F